MALFEIEPDRRTLHGAFSRDAEPILTIDSGDTVCYRTLDAGWGLERPIGPGQPGQKFSPRIEERDNGHALCGPVAIRGAQPGMVLEIDIISVRPGPYGWTSSGGWENEITRRLDLTTGPEFGLIWDLDADRGIGESHLGHQVTLSPFMGVMGMPSDEPGWHPSWIPRVHGGNLDCKELVAGSTLFLPIAVPGGLFSVGDGHGLQGDGEVGTTAIECPMDRVELMFRLHEDLRLSTPRARTQEAWLTLGFHEDLNEASYRALDAMLELMGEQYGLERKAALALASVVVDLRVTQICNGVKGVHALLPHHAIGRASRS